jgi:hypothetical protein
MTKLEQAKERWGTAAVVKAPRTFTPVRRGVAASFSVSTPRVSRVVEQRRDVSSYRLDRSTTP